MSVHGESHHSDSGDGWASEDGARSPSPVLQSVTMEANPVVSGEANPPVRGEANPAVGGVANPAVGEETNSSIGKDVSALVSPDADGEPTKIQPLAEEPFLAAEEGKPQWTEQLLRFFESTRQQRGKQVRPLKVASGCTGLWSDGMAMKAPLASVVLCLVASL